MYFDSADMRLAALEDLYAWSETVGSPEAALHGTRKLLRGDKAVLLKLSATGGDDCVIATSGALSEFAVALLRNRDSKANFLQHFRSWDQDNAYDSARLIDEESLCESDFYRNFLQPNDLAYAVAGVVERRPAYCTLLCIYRSPNAPPFESSDNAQLRALMPHWRRAMALQLRLTRLDQQSGIAHCILNHAPFAIMTVDASGTVLYANQRAKSISNLDDGLRIRDGRIAASTAYNTQRLLKELRREKTPQEVLPVPFPIDRPSGAKPYQLMIMPIQTNLETSLGTGSTYGIFVYDPSRHLPVDGAALKSLEGLTDSEARLCESLYETKNLGESAEQLNVSLSTAKTHLLNTFRKLGINSQAELMRYLAHMPKMSPERLQ